MKKTFAVAGALTAVATVLAVAPAFAADPIKLSVGGYGAVMVGYASQDDDYLKATNTEATGADVKGDNEIHFKGSTTLDNGLTISVKYELESGGRSLNDPADTYNVTVSGGFGSIVAGADGNALMAIAKGAPRVGGRLFNGGFDEGDLVDGNYVLSAGVDTAVDATYVNTGSDAESISYISPSVYGFTFGATYVPNAGSEDIVAQPTATAGNAGSNEAYGAGLMWDGSFSGVTVGLEGGYLWADNGANNSRGSSAGVAGNTTNDYNGARQEWQVGGQISYAGFGFGAAYRNIDQDLNRTSTGHKTGLEGRAWEAGASYKTGPYGVSLSYFDSSMENDNNAAGVNVSDDTIKAWELAGEYTMGPGVALVGGVGYVDFENGTANGSSQTVVNSNQNSGWVVATGLSLTF